MIARRHRTGCQGTGLWTVGGGQRRTRCRRSSFTLIELLLVLVILSVLSGVVVVSVGGYRKRANIVAGQQQVRMLETALDLFEVDNGEYPEGEDLEGLRELWESSGDSTKIYLKKEVERDPWGNSYKYRSPGKYNENSYDVWSMGADGEDGTEDDIGSWQQFEVPKD